MSARDAILARLAASAAVPSHLQETDADVASRLDAAWDAQWPDDPKALAGLFAQALEAVSGEYHGAASISDAAAIVARIAASLDHDRIALGGGALCQAVAEGLPSELSPVAVPQGAGRSRVLAEAPLALVEAAWGVAETGSVAFPYAGASTMQPHFLTETVIVLLPKERLVPHLKALFQKLSPDEQKNLALVTGPSRTADIEKVLILGAHGPKRWICVVLD